MDGIYFLYEDKISSSLRDLPTRAHSIISMHISKKNLKVGYSHVILDHRIITVTTKNIFEKCLCLYSKRYCQNKHRWKDIHFPIKQAKDFITHFTLLQYSIVIRGGKLRGLVYKTKLIFSNLPFNKGKCILCRFMIIIYSVLPKLSQSIILHKMKVFFWVWNPLFMPCCCFAASYFG